MLANRKEEHPRSCVRGCLFISISSLHRRRSFRPARAACAEYTFFCNAADFFAKEGGEDNSCKRTR